MLIAKISTISILLWITSGCGKEEIKKDHSKIFILEARASSGMEDMEFEEEGTIKRGSITVPPLERSYEESSFRIKDYARGGKCIALIEDGVHKFRFDAETGILNFGKYGDMIKTADDVPNKGIYAKFQFMYGSWSPVDTIPGHTVRIEISGGLLQEYRTCETRI